MNSGRILIVGIGQAGNNITQKILDVNPRIQGYFINSNQNDWHNLKSVTKENSYVVPCASGTGRDRDRAAAFVKDQVYALTDTFKKYPNQDNIFIAFSMGGGTGSGMTPVLMKVFEKINPNLKINLIGIAPKRTETRKAQTNALECWKELKNLDNMGMFFLIDNNVKKDIHETNKEFATLFNRMLQIPREVSADGIIDEGDLSKVAGFSGLAAIYDLSDAILEGDDMDIEEDVIEDSIFIMPTNRCIGVGFNAPSTISDEVVVDYYKPRKKDAGYKSLELFRGNGDTVPTLIITGGRPVNSALEDVKNTIEEQESKLLNDEDKDDDTDDTTFDKFIEKPKENTSKKKKEINIEKELQNNPEAFWNNIFS